MPRFAILTHDWPALHWDLLLEDTQQETCRTWRLKQMPDAVRACRAERIADHRTMYLSYEGPVSQDRGQVTQWDAGTYELLVGCLADGNAEIQFELKGQRLEGRYRIRGADPTAQGQPTVGDVSAAAAWLWFEPLG